MAISSPTPPRERRSIPGAAPLVRLWAAAFLVRLAGVGVSLLLFQHFLIAADTKATYLPLARNLAAGLGYQLNGDNVLPTRVPPLFPLWLSFLVMMSGGNPPLWFAGLFNAAFRAGGCVLLYLLTRRHFGSAPALAASVLYLLDPWETLWVGYMLKESLAVPLFLLGVWLLCRMADRPTWGRAAAAGAAIGVATLARYPNGSLWIAGFLMACVAVVPLFKSPGARFARASVLTLALTGGMLLTLSPWIVRNWRVTGHPMLSTQFVGQYLYTSNASGKVLETGGYADPRGVDYSVLPRKPEEFKHAPLQKELRLLRLVTGQIARNPGEFAARLGAKMVNMWRPTFGTYSVRNLLFLAIPYCLLMALSLGGVVLAAKRRLPCLALAAPLLVLLAIHLLYWAEIRNRQYLTPLLYAFGGLAVAEICSLPTVAGFLRRARGDSSPSTEAA